MSWLISIPILAIVLMLQTVVVSSLPLVNGYADLMLLVLVAWGLQGRAQSAWIWAVVAGILVGLVSSVPTGIPLVGYVIVTAIARLFRRQVWQTPILSMFLVTFLGSLITQGLAMIALILKGTPLPLYASINLVILPGTLLNLMLVLPVYAIVSDLSQLVYPEEVEV